MTFYRVCREDHPTRCVVVKHTDSGPGRGPRRRGAIVDLTPAAFRRLAHLDIGVIPVTVEAMP